MEAALFIVYMVAAYWAAGKTIYANKIQIGTMKNIVLSRLCTGVLLGPFIIPIAIIRVIFHI